MTSLGRAVLVLVWGVLLGAACRQEEAPDVGRTEAGALRLGTVEVVDTAMRAVALSDRPLVLEGLRGSVHVRGAAQATADLSFVRRGRGASLSEGQAVLGGISITERGTDAKYTYTLEAAEESYAAVDVRGHVPREAALRIRRTSGPVRIDSVAGPLVIAHEHGDVTMRGVQARVDVQVKNGDLTVGFRALPEAGDLLLETANGDVEVRLPGGRAVQIEARTNAGEIRTQGLVVGAEQFVPKKAGGRYSAQLGDGGPSLDIRTQNGSISVRAAPSAPSPDDRPSSDTVRPLQPDADTASRRPDTTAAPSAPAPSAPAPSAPAPSPAATPPDTTGAGPGQ
jgi:hypothetical protein